MNYIVWVQCDDEDICAIGDERAILVDIVSHKKVLPEQAQEMLIKSDINNPLRINELEYVCWVELERN